MKCSRCKKEYFWGYGIGVAQIMTISIINAFWGLWGFPVGIIILIIGLFLKWILFDTKRGRSDD